MKAAEKLANIKRTAESRCYGHTDAYVCEECLLLARVAGDYRLRNKKLEARKGTVRLTWNCDACFTTNTTIYGIFKP